MGPIGIENYGGSGGSGGSGAGWARWTGWAGGGGGPSGAGVGIYDTPMIADALIKHRDGTVAAWGGKKSRTPIYPGIDEVKYLWDQEPWVRAAVMDMRMLSGIHFYYPDKTGAVSIGHLAFSNEIDATTKEIVRVTRPPQTAFEAQLIYLDSYADLREDRASEILTQIGPQQAFWSTVSHVHPTRTLKTNELLDFATRFAVITEMRYKHAFNCPRPQEYSEQVQPMILTPGHGTFPAGHAVQAYFIAHVLSELVEPGNTKLKEQLMRQAARVSVNRVVAGVHFPVDLTVGRMIGIALAEYFISQCTSSSGSGSGYTKAEFQCRHFDGVAFEKEGSPDFDPNEDINIKGKYIQTVGTPIKAPDSAILSWLWTRARREWDGSVRN